MKHTDNYLLQAQQAKAHFLGYDQAHLIQKLNLAWDDAYLYTQLFRRPYRIHRKTGDLERKSGEDWIPANSYEEVMTLLDLVCDSREDRCLSGTWKNMASFGLLFHQNLLEGGGRKLDTTADIAYAIEIFDGLEIALQLWFGDADFPANLRLLWDENALLYIRYETMYFARGLLLNLLKEAMEK